MTRRVDWAIYALTIVLSFFGHMVLLEGLGRAALKAPVHRRAPVEMAVFEVAPSPPPEPEPPPKPKPKRKPKPPPSKEIDLTRTPPPQPEAPPPSNTQDESEPITEPPKPVFGVTMSSVVGPGTGSGFSVRVGNTLMKEREEELTPPEQVKSYNKPLSLHKVTRIPKKKGDCRAPYPNQARAMGIEGPVKLEVHIRADGTVGDVRVVEGIGYGLDEAAIRALKRCRFEPAMIGEQAVPTKIPYTYRFIIED